MPENHLSLTLIGLAAGCVLFGVLARNASGFDPEDAALGQNTVTHSAHFEGLPVSTRRLPDPAFCDAIRSLRAEQHPIALWLGASQLHGINEMQSGDQLGVRYANDRASSRSSSLRHVQISFANGNLNEFLATYLTLRQSCAVPDWLVISLTYDDLREPGIRRSVIDALPELSDDLVALVGGGGRNLQIAQSDPGRQAPVRRTVTSGTPQEYLETFLSGGLERIWPDYAARAKVQAKAGLNAEIAIAVVAGRLLQRRVPPVPPDLQRWNEVALDSLLRLAAADEVGVLLYQAPHRPDPGPFYHDRRAYDEWHAGIRSRSATGEFAVIDLETLVPTEYWGITNQGRPDFFHFTAEGHRRLGEAIDRSFEAKGAHALQ